MDDLKQFLVEIPYTSSHSRYVRIGGRKDLDIVQVFTHDAQQSDGKVVNAAAAASRRGYLMSALLGTPGQGAAGTACSSAILFSPCHWPMYATLAAQAVALGGFVAAALTGDTSAMNWSDVAYAGIEIPIHLEHVPKEVAAQLLDSDAMCVNPYQPGFFESVCDLELGDAGSALYRGWTSVAHAMFWPVTAASLFGIGRRIGRRRQVGQIAHLDEDVEISYEQHPLIQTAQREAESLDIPQLIDEANIEGACSQHGKNLSDAYDALRMYVGQQETTSDRDALVRSALTEEYSREAKLHSGRYSQMRDTLAEVPYGVRHVLASVVATIWKGSDVIRDMRHNRGVLSYEH